VKLFQGGQRLFQESRGSQGQGSQKSDLQTGMAPNQPPIRFMSETLMPIVVTDVVGILGSKSEAR
jgi:hypothetical protein